MAEIKDYKLMTEKKTATRKRTPKKPDLADDVKTLKEISERIPKDPAYRVAMKHCVLAANSLQATLQQI